MARIKKITLTVLVALTLAAGGLAASAGAEQVTDSPGCHPICLESASLPTQAEELQQVASSAGTRAKIARESA